MPGIGTRNRTKLEMTQITASRLGCSCRAATAKRGGVCFSVLRRSGTDQEKQRLFAGMESRLELDFYYDTLGWIVESITHKARTCGHRNHNIRIEDVKDKTRLDDVYHLHCVRCLKCALYLTSSLSYVVIDRVFGL
jgi:hypothetical protein